MKAISHLFTEVKYLKKNNYVPSSYFVVLCCGLLLFNLTHILQGDVTVTWTIVGANDTTLKNRSK